ncbi:MAG: exodeoxyribonuclease V subunit gamma [Xanthomonadaceae bacterium]|jgi:exodeoxyribonuclease V gamma subunit|nr:exodeoxyribonuclease V subunit gamma [Xanthomonadaceae bacterium]
MNELPQPGFHLVSGNFLDDLAGHLSTRLSEPLAADALWPETLLIPQPTLRRWLQVELTRRLGVAANLEFLTPSEFVWRLLRAAHSGLPEESPWDQEHLRWRIYALLSVENLPEAVSDHLCGADALVRWRLAESLAQAFDKYQAYRRGWLEAWDAGEMADDWQAVLWRRLRQARTPPRSHLIGDWLQRYHAGRIEPPGLPVRLSAFGTINVSPDVLRILAVVAGYRELVFYRPSPCAEYWGDVETLRQSLRNRDGETLIERLAQAQDDNPLLKAWGGAGRDFVAQLFSYEWVQPGREEERFVEPPRDSLLHALQSDVLARRSPYPLSDLRDEDLSLQVHVCHSCLREVEILHDRLRGLFDADTTLRPEDVAVLAPNIGDYLPLVRAVFDGLQADDPRFIPFTLSDRPQVQIHPLIGLFLSLLDLPQSRRTVSDVLDLLNVPTVMTALELQETDLERLGAWFDEAGIRWGDDEAMRERLGFGRWREYSFAFGLDRLLLGYATGESGALVAGIAPSAGLEGADGERLNRLLKVLRRLQELSIELQSPRPAPEWGALLARQFSALLPEAPLDDAERQARRIVLEALDRFARQAADAGPLPATVVTAALQDLLHAPSPHQPFLGGGVTFAGMVPLRTVPFRVICLLGMDADAFPRREPRGDINRLIGEIHGGARRLGDRSVREDDRFLFLQLLSAARDVFYISYCGRDTRDDRVLEPSLMVSELLDAAQAYLPPVRDDSDTEHQRTDARRRWLIEHPLQPFSPQAFGADDRRRFSYRHEWWQSGHGGRSTTTPFASEPIVMEEQDDATIALTALQAFLRNPARTFLRDRLGLRLPYSGGDDHDSEPLGDQPLVRYQLTRHLLDYDDDDPALRARGLLNSGFDGVRMAEQTRAIVAAIRESAQKWLQETGIAVANIPVPSPVAGLRIDTDRLPAGGGVHAGQGRACFPNPRTVLLAGDAKGKHRLPALIEHLLSAAAIGEEARTALFWHQNGKIESAPLPTMSRIAAHAWLEDLVALYWQGQARPLPFAADAAWAYVRTLDKQGDSEAAWKAAVATFDDHQGFGDGYDPWFQLAFRPGGMLADSGSEPGMEFRQLAVRVFSGPGGEE